MIRTTKDGRTIRTGKHYSDFRRGVWWVQDGLCLVCGRLTGLYADIQADYSFHLAHAQTRGMGGGFRDDVIGEKKGQVQGGKCGKCHRKEHNQ